VIFSSHELTISLDGDVSAGGPQEYLIATNYAESIRYELISVANNPATYEIFVTTYGDHKRGEQTFWNMPYAGPGAAAGGGVCDAAIAAVIANIDTNITAILADTANMDINIAAILADTANIDTNVAALAAALYSPTVTNATGAFGVISQSTSLGTNFELLAVTMHWDAAQVTSTDFAVTLDANDGAAYDTVLFTADPTSPSTTDLVYTPDTPIVCEAGDEIKVTYSNGDSDTWGLRIVTRQIP
jgi:hypothetical protein